MITLIGWLDEWIIYPKSYGCYDSYLIRLFIITSRKPVLRTMKISLHQTYMGSARQQNWCQGYNFPIFLDYWHHLRVAFWGTKMVNFGPIFLFFGSFYAGLTLWNESRLRNFRISNRFLDIASQSWWSGVSKMATYI